MNKPQARHFSRNAWRLAALLAALFAVSGLRAADEPQPGRFLLIFETSPVLKKNLPVLRQLVGDLFAHNIQNEIETGDDLAVWTVDQQLHTGTFPLASWSPDDAEMSAERLDDFLGNQKFTRHASLAALQPLLNRVVKNSERLTVVIVCDSQSRLVGTPYDSGVNEIISNAVTRIKGPPVPFLLVLRAYHGEYLGCSVNRWEPLNFPKFPPPPKPELPQVANPAPAPAPAPVPVAPPVSGPIVTPVPALIIVGTNASTNVSALMQSASPAAVQPAPPPAPVPSATTPTVPTSPLPTVPPKAPPKVAAAPSANPAPVVNPPAPVQPLPAPVAELTKTSESAPAVAATPAAVAPASPAITPPTSPASAVAESTPADPGYLWPLFIGGGSLVVAAGLVLWLVTRSRQPRGSLITSSMQNDPRLPPPRK